PLLPAPALDPAALGARRRGAADPARDPASARRLRGGRAAAPPRRDPRRHDARVGVGRRGRARQRHADPDELARLDGRRRAEPGPARVVVAARREGPRRGRRAPPRAWARARVDARRLCARPEHPQRPARPADVPARAPPGAAPRPQPLRDAAAVRLSDARPGRDARPAQGDRRGARAAPARLPRLVGDPDVPPVPAPTRAAEAPRGRRLDGRPLLPPGHRRAGTARTPREAAVTDITALFGLRLTTPRLELRVPTRDELVELRAVAHAGIHPPEFMPFAVAWTDEPYSERWVVAFHEEQLAAWK